MCEALENPLVAAVTLSGCGRTLTPLGVPASSASQLSSSSSSESGGRVLLTGKSGIDAEKGFVFDVGAKWQGPSPYSEGDYLLPVECG